MSVIPKLAARATFCIFSPLRYRILMLCIDEHGKEYDSET